MLKHFYPIIKYRKPKFQSLAALMLRYHCCLINPSNTFSYPLTHSKALHLRLPQFQVFGFATTIVIDWPKFYRSCWKIRKCTNGRKPVAKKKVSARSDWNRRGVFLISYFFVSGSFRMWLPYIGGGAGSLPIFSVRPFPGNRFCSRGLYTFLRVLLFAISNVNRFAGWAGMQASCNESAK